MICEGQSRSTRTLSYLLHTPDAFVRAPLPTLLGGQAIVHASPRLGAGFVHYTAEFEPGGTLAPVAAQRFLYTLAGSGTAALEMETSHFGGACNHALRPGAYAYLPPGERANITAGEGLVLSVIEKSYEPFHGVQEPSACLGYEDEVAPEPLAGAPGVQVRTLLPAPPRSPFGYDFAVNTLEYAPGAELAQVEVHVMEHGMVMLGGNGRYRLGDAFYEVAAGDFIWMAPFCPQWFGNTGAAPAKYLIYKDWNRCPKL